MKLIDFDEELENLKLEILNKEKLWDDLKYDIELYFEILRSKGYYIIFILDEFDEARNKFESNPSAFREIRHLGYDSEQYGIAFVTTSRRSIRDIEIQSKVSSTLDGIFGKEYLIGYNSKEMHDYYQLYKKNGINLNDKHKQRIEYYCGGHPYLLASLGFEIVESFKENELFDIDIIFEKIMLQFFDYYEQLISLLKEDKTFLNLLQILFGPKINVSPSIVDELLVYGLIIKGEKYYKAFSEHFQNYLKYKEKEEVIELDIWKLISQAEKGLRKLILHTLDKNFGDNWEKNYPKKYKDIPNKMSRLNTIFDKLKEAYKRDISQYGSLALNLTLLDQTYIHQLFDYFILFSWNDLFKPIFQKNNKYWNEIKKHLEKIRNPIAHQKIEILLESEIKKAEEYCIEILNIIENYHFT